MPELSDSEIADLSEITDTDQEESGLANVSSVELDVEIGLSDLLEKEENEDSCKECVLKKQKLSEKLRENMCLKIEVKFRF